MLLKSVQTGCTTNVSRKCVPGARTSDRECAIALSHTRPRPRDVECEAGRPDFQPNNVPRPGTTLVGTPVQIFWSKKLIIRLKDCGIIER